jgi:signal transduction histidine kinase
MKRYLDKLDSSAKRMSQLIHSLLNFSRLSKHRDPKQQTSLDQVLKEVLEDMELLIREKQVVVTSDKLPVVTGYNLQLQQLFANLIGNAVKFAVDQPHIHIGSGIVGKKEIPDAPEYLANGKYAHLSFSDNGIGFDPQYGELIFSLFQRLHEKHVYEGTGIGLALCRKITDNHDGYISAEAKPGSGATFHVYLPVED